MAMLAAAGGLSTGLQVLGMAVGFMGQMAAANQAKAAAKMEQQRMNYEAKQLDIRAKEEMAQSQQEALALRKRKELAQSTVQARAAASGFSATDANTLDIVTGIEEEGEMQALMAMYGGKARRAGVERQAEGRRYSGKIAYAAGKAQANSMRIGAIGGLFKGLAGLSTPSFGQPTATPTLLSSGGTYQPMMGGYR